MPADDGRGRLADVCVRVGRRIALIRSLEHAEVILAVPETNHPGDLDLLTQKFNGAAFAGGSMMNVQPFP